MSDNKVQFNIQRVYLKDLSFESPMTPDIFTNLSSSPKVGFNFESNIKELADDIHELTLTFNVKACLLYTSPSPRDATLSRMPSSA